MQGIFNITAKRNIQGYKITNVKANIITTNIIWIVFFCLFVSPSGFRDSEQWRQYVKRFVFLPFCMSENEAPQLQSSFCWFLKVFSLVLWNKPRWAQHPAWHHAVGCEVEAIEHAGFPQCVSVAEPLVLNVCVLFHWENSMFSGSPSFSFHTYGEEAQWLPIEFSLWSNTDGLVQGSLKGIQGKMLCFCLFFLFYVHFFPFKVYILYN